ncbi:MAG: hypothetical protein AB7N80_14495 [Bdellovibrionales bacterium]
MAQPAQADPRLADGRIIRPYVFVRAANRIQNPGRNPLGWFPNEPLIKDSQSMHEGVFTDQILNLENKVFGQKLAMPRWVFYDCAIMPGIVSGYAIHRAAATAAIKAVTEAPSDAEWIPLSLFITIPTLRPGEWVAHNLSSINSALPAQERFYGLGFMSKAFGLWYANIETCCGMTQWSSPAIKLHSHYGDIEVLTAYTPSHTYASTLTYRLKVKPNEWERFFTEQKAPRFYEQYRPAGFGVARSQESSLKDLQRRLEAGEGPYFLDADEIGTRPLDSELTLFRPS